MNGIPLSARGQAAIASGEHRLSFVDTFFPRRALRRRQRAFAEARRQASQSDDGFLRTVCEGCPSGQREFVLELRKSLARCCNCDTRCVGADDSTSELHPVMGETSFFGWFITLGDLGPEETFFRELERLYEKTSGKPAYLDFAVQHGLREMWVNGCLLSEWIRAVLARLEQASHVPASPKVRRHKASR